MYQPLQNTCADITVVIDKPTLSSLYGYRGVSQVNDPQGNVGTVQAINIETGRTAWKYSQRAPTLSLVSTAGGVVFGGDYSGKAFALDAKTGKVLWEVNLGSPLSGYPVTYSVKGVQYVAFSSSQQTPQTAILQLVPELHPSLNSQLFVFKLP
jgi:alcohol dehydrogenase (cytochrome c)